ncbi:RNA polymerase sigma factor [Exilibacterium tricleocarpae]|uniref:RNA polymerase sigma factor n=1 Tax=Exilibacterium tricleocarpae TaxID=2591008 RepID=A0A545SSQ9_9GAMM|nr:RNA polymerase sigma factor [Exilibacterium tricleocarpae]TQV68002.1 RNA polymerase sigma factor [Exilibacterium tricleocarpae]
MRKLVAQYRGALLSFFNRREQSPWDAEELTQEVFCKILKSSHEPVDPYPESYLYTVAWSVLKDKSRRDRVRLRNQHVSFDEAYAKGDQVSPELTLSSDQLYARFLQALDSMSPSVRTVFVLNRYEGLSYSQIAKRCGISVSAVEKHMMKALVQLKHLTQDP